MKDETRYLAIGFEAGEKTCWNPKTGKWCRWARTKRFGSMQFCQIWGRELKDQYGDPSGIGSLQRLPECLESEILEVKKNKKGRRG